MVSSFEKAEYPPRIYNCKIRQLMDEHPDKPNIAVLAQAVGVTPLTMMRIIDGADVKLRHAFKIAEIFGKTIPEIWEPR